MSTQYKKFIKLLEKWPIDATKGDRDLGLFIRNRVQLVFGSSVDKSNTVNCAQQLETLNKIADNHYLKKYKRKSQSTATGLTAEECNAILSTESLKYLEEENKGFLSKIFSKKD